MSSQNPSLAGVWSLIKARGKNIDGDWVEEKVIGGTGVLTPEGLISAFMKTSEYSLGFTGRYTYDGKKLIQTTLASSNTEYESRPIEREFTLVEPDLLKIDAIDEVTGLPYELVLRRINEVK